MRFLRYAMVPVLILALGTLASACSSGQTGRLQRQGLVNDTTFWASSAFYEVNDLYRMVTLGSDAKEIEGEHRFSDVSVLADLQARKASGALASYDVTEITFPGPGQLIDFKGTGSPLEALARVFEYPSGSGSPRIYEYHLSLVVLDSRSGAQIFQFESYHETS